MPMKCTKMRREMSGVCVAVCVEDGFLVRVFKVMFTQAYATVGGDTPAVMSVQCKLA